MHTTMLVLHLIGVAAWLGGNLTLAFAGSMSGGADPVARRWWAVAQGSMARIYFSLAATLVLVTGVVLVLDEDGVEFSDTFVSIGFLAVIVGLVLGIFVFGPGTRQIVGAIDDGDAAAERAGNSRLAINGVVSSLVLVVTIVAMVAGW